MPFFAVLRKPLKTGYFANSNSKNPCEKELLNNLLDYQQVYLLNSLEDAHNVAESMFHRPHPPKVSGAYGLVAEVTAEFKDTPIATGKNASAIYNSWVDSQILSYIKLEKSKIEYQCIVVSPEQIKSISRIYIPNNAKTHNPNLEDKDFTRAAPKCLIL